MLRSAGKVRRRRHSHATLPVLGCCVSAPRRLSVEIDVLHSNCDDGFVVDFPWPCCPAVQRLCLLMLTNTSMLSTLPKSPRNEARPTFITILRAADSPVHHPPPTQASRCHQKRPGIVCRSAGRYVRTHQLFGKYTSDCRSPIRTRKTPDMGSRRLQSFTHYEANTVKTKGSCGTTII